ncbi:hypothetical protein [Tsukamurella ocularis]|uniref:hypothetical protein n=1 Tax=Tsukamurella ocularis TaxID=1970234 RepID=UPI00216979D9|nr:hypothetical protein [Tsukamurella ocularis]MCS3853290.1 hypothetical protein [Tsukamurella ocularis]
MMKNTSTILSLSILAVVSIGALTACGQSTDTAAPSTPAAPPVPAGATLHHVDAPLNDITSLAEHCFDSVTDAMLARQRAKDYIADRNSTHDAKQTAHDANSANPLPEIWEKKLRLDETAPHCYKVSLLNPPAPGTTGPA